ncbi:hypothetical protein SEA_JONJAMES_121 [Gordonia Phage JonJames]|nr:hypothetical protein SEA_JONJAMES_121 [Gordonia Phage JonJames]
MSEPSFPEGVYVLSQVCWSYDNFFRESLASGTATKFEDYVKTLLVEGPILDYVLLRWEEDHG